MSPFHKPMRVPRMPNATERQKQYIQTLCNHHGLDEDSDLFRNAGVVRNKTSFPKSVDDLYVGEAAKVIQYILDQFGGIFDYDEDPMER